MGVLRADTALTGVRRATGPISADNTNASQLRSQIADYPYDEYHRRFGRDGALVEVTVLGAVPDILDLTDKIEGAINWAFTLRGQATG